MKVVVDSHACVKELLSPGSGLVSELSAFKIRLDTRVADFEEGRLRLSFSRFEPSFVNLILRVVWPERGVIDSCMFLGGVSSAFFLAKLHLMATELDTIITKLHAPSGSVSQGARTGALMTAVMSASPAAPNPPPPLSAIPQPVHTPAVTSAPASAAAFDPPPVVIHPSRVKLVERPAPNGAALLLGVGDALEDVRADQTVTLSARDESAKRKPARTTVDEDNMQDSDEMEWEHTADDSASGPLAGSVSASSSQPATKPGLKKKVKKKKDLGHMQGLVDKWNVLKETNNKEEDRKVRELETRLNPVLSQRRAQEEIEKWKQEALATGLAEDNPNFIPVGDWRSRVAKARKQL
jgi:hypothetical protein